MDIKSKSLSEVEDFVTSFNIPKFQAKNIFRAIHQQNIKSINKITNLSKDFRQKLKDEKYYISNLRTKEIQVDKKDGTKKYLFCLDDGNVFETVLLKDKKRLSVCASTQSGCRMNCAFCATGNMGFNRNLKAGEIVDQVYKLGINVNNIVFMGMGEPFDNYDEVLKAVKILNNPLGKNIGVRKITISTCGIVPGIDKLSKENIQVRLAISLHVCNESKRRTIMPISKKYNLKVLKESLKRYQKETGRRVTIEFLLLKEINDSKEEINNLLAFLSGLNAHVNLINYNDFRSTNFQPVSVEIQKLYKHILEDKGYPVSIRFKRGEKIMAACGQLGGDKNC